MEVHHHPQLENREKRLKEYVLEGLMIFMAVLMGFIAENIREHLSDQNKKKELLEIVGQAFNKDLDQLKFHEKYAKQKIDAINFIIKYFDSEQKIINKKDYYQYINKITGWWFFNSEEKSRIEAESKGYFYEKENSELVNVILRFNFFKNDYKNTEVHEAKLIEKCNEQIQYITNFNIYNKQNHYPPPIMLNTFGIINLNKSELIKIKYILSNISMDNDIYLNDIDSMKVYAKKAIEIIKKNTHNESTLPTPSHT